MCGVKISKIIAIFSCEIPPITSEGDLIVAILAFVDMSLMGSLLSQV